MASLSDGIAQKRLRSIADGLVVAVAVTLPWSTSATAILAVLSVLVLLCTLRWPELRREIMSPAGGLPVLLVVLGIVGMLWADVPLLDRWKGLDSFLKLLAIPLLLAQFRRSERGEWVFIGYLLSCLVLLLVTIIVMATPWASSLLTWENVLVKNATTQSGEFVTCIFGLLYLVRDAAQRREWWKPLSLVAIIIIMLADIFYASTGRTAPVVALVLLVLFATKSVRAKGIALLVAGVAVLGAVGWASSPYLRFRVGSILTEINTYQTTNERTPSGERIEFWKKSIEFIREAPVIGHGTGLIHGLFEKSAIGQTGTTAVAAANPHNQTLAVGIQLGLIGIVVLWAMWMAHLLLFRGEGIAAWIGLVIVVQNFVGSLFNSHLFDFTQGWTYVVGVGVAGGMVRSAMQNFGGHQHMPPQNESARSIDASTRTR